MPPPAMVLGAGLVLGCLAGCAGGSPAPGSPRPAPPVPSGPSATAAADPDQPVDLVRGRRTVTGTLLPVEGGCRLLRTADGLTVLLLGRVPPPGDDGALVRVEGVSALVSPGCRADLAVTVVGAVRR